MNDMFEVRAEARDFASPWSEWCHRIRLAAEWSGTAWKRHHPKPTKHCSIYIYNIHNVYMWPYSPALGLLKGLTHSMQSKLAVKLLTPNQVQGLKLRSTLLHQIYVENEMPNITGQWPTGGTKSTQGATALQTSQLNRENFPTNYFSPIKCQAISKNNQLPSGALTVLVRCPFAHGVLGVRLQVPYCTKATVSAKGPSHGNPAVDWSHSPAPGSPSRGSPQPMAWEMLENYGKIGDRITQLWDWGVNLPSFHHVSIISPWQT
jgi:hypothetical protein